MNRVPRPWRETAVAVSSPATSLLTIWAGVALLPERIVVFLPIAGVLMVANLVITMAWHPIFGTDPIIVPERQTHFAEAPDAR